MSGKPRIVLLGPPASGKGTQAGSLSVALDVSHVSTGRMFREMISRGGSVGNTVREFIDKGQLMPDEITIQVVKDWLDKVADSEGFIMDGFPRTEVQAAAFDCLLAERQCKLTAAILLEVTVEDTVRRVLGRLGCECCGALYHADLAPPRVGGVCDHCGGRLQRRADDTDETVRERLRIYRELTGGVVRYYERAGILRTVDASGPRALVFSRVWEKLAA
jgi:adenylate kinase